MVISRGTNTLEETAYFLNLTLNTSKPVIITRAQKPFSALGSDAYFNLLNSFQVAACPQAAGQWVLVRCGAVLPIECYRDLDLLTLGDLPPQKPQIWLLLHLLSQAQAA